MKCKSDIYCVTFALILITFLGACSPLESANTTKSISLDQWAANYIDKDEELLCKREEDGEYFFLAKEAAGDRVKVGSLIDVSSYRHQTHALIVVWKFRNEKGGPLVTKVLPSAVQEAYVKVDGKTYAENMQYQTLHLKDSQEMHVTIDIKKCPTENCSREKTASKEEEQYRVELCEIPLDKQ